MPGISLAQSASFPRNVADIDGNVVHLAQEPQRIISLDASITEILYTLDLGPRIVGINEASDYPPDTANKPKIGNIYLNYEKIVSLKPDIIILQKRLHTRDIAKIRRLKIPVLLANAENFDELIQSIFIIGRATGREAQARKAASEVKKEMDAINQAVRETPPEKRPRVFVEIWNAPLTTAGGDTFVNFIIENAGGINIAREKIGYPAVNPETLLVRNPDVIVLTTSKESDFTSNRLWRNIKAVREKKVFTINPDIFVRPTLRVTEGCRKLHEWLKQ